MVLRGIGIRAKFLQKILLNLDLYSFKIIVIPTVGVGQPSVSVGQP